MLLIDWIKRHKLTTLLLLVVVYFLFKSTVGSPLATLRSVGFGAPTTSVTESYSRSGEMAQGAPTDAKMGLAYPGIIPPQPDYPPQAQIKDRLVIANSYLSLLVKNVTEVKDKIVDFASTNGGYMVNSNISNPQDAPTATVTVRIPAPKLKTALEYFHSLAVKVVSENLEGQDVTDQYVDIAANIGTLEKTKAKFESILAQATEISDITNLNQQIISIQSQIDSYKGQQDALAKNAEQSKITVYLATDEIALPYAPSETFRPAVIFKLAVRSLVSQLRSVAAFAIWVVVYAVIWIPVLVLAGMGYRKFIKGQTTENENAKR